jgi:hypothetical protein
MIPTIRVRTPAPSFVRVTFAVVLLGTMMSGTVFADSILIQEGRLGFSFDSPPGFALSGRGFFVTSFWPAVAETSVFQCQYPSSCPPGTEIDLSGVFGGELGNFGLGLGGATVGNATFGIHAMTDPIELRGTLTFDAPSVIVPTATEGLILLTAPYAFHGQIAGFFQGGVDPLFETDVHGSGRVAFTLFGLDGYLPPYRFAELDYGFAPTPEPSTLLLVGTALAGVGVARRTRQRGRAR